LSSVVRMTPSVTFQLLDIFLLQLMFLGIKLRYKHS